MVVDSSDEEKSNEEEEEGFTKEECFRAFLLMDKLGRLEFTNPSRGIESNKLDETCRGLLSELLDLFDRRPELRARMHLISLAMG